VATIAEELRKEGHRKGFLRLLLKQLRLRFGKLDDVTLTRVTAADQASLDQYAQRILSATSLELLLAEHRLSDGRTPGMDAVCALASRFSDPALRQAAIDSAEPFQQEGCIQGQRALILTQLERQFAPLDESSRARINAANEATLDRYAERMLVAATPAAVLAD
jgi:hypothetical protein